jgi:hypothetical protein
MNRRVGRRAIFAMLLIVAIVVIWKILRTHEPRLKRRSGEPRSGAGDEAWQVCGLHRLQAAPNQWPVLNLRVAYFGQYQETEAAPAAGAGGRLGPPIPTASNAEQAASGQPNYRNSVDRSELVWSTSVGGLFQPPPRRAVLVSLPLGAQPLVPSPFAS